MDKLKLLELKKLTKELDYVEIDFDYKQEIVNEADTKFINTINEFLKSHPELKKQYDDKINKLFDEKDKEREEDLDIENNDEDVDLDNDLDGNEQEEEEKSEKIERKKKTSKSSKLKKLYREIVKITHPDKTKDVDLNKIYIEATDYYDENNIIGIYKICNDLNIDYEMDENDHSMIKNRISQLKEKIKFLEATFTWNWYNAENDEIKNQILMNYIKLKIQQ
jgi:hypothetical protein